MDRAAKSLMCAFGAGCKHGLNCHRGHTGVEKKIFADKKEIREKEWMAPCAFCAVGQCRYGAECQRSIRSRLSNEVYQKQSTPAAESESDYASAESGSDSGSESADEAGMTGHRDAVQRVGFLTVRWFRFSQRISQRSSKVGGRVLGQQMLGFVGLGNRQYSGC